MDPRKTIAKVRRTIVDITRARFTVWEVSVIDGNKVDLSKRYCHIIYYYVLPVEKRNEMKKNLTGILTVVHKRNNIENNLYSIRK